MITVEKVAYGGWQNGWRLANAQVELIIPQDIGIRIMRYGFIGKENLLAEIAGQLGTTGGDDWRIYGGHRLWLAPEDPIRTYENDNHPVKVEPLADGVLVTQNIDPRTGIQKQVEITLDDHNSHVTLTHRTTNHHLWAVSYALWALSVMNTGGTGIVPFPPRGLHETNLLPASTLTLWAYTDLTDPRWTFGTKYLLLRQDPTNTKPQKIGASVPDGWAAYARHGQLFVKRFASHDGLGYPDVNCSVEMFTNNLFLEVETLSKLHTVQPGATIEHTEHWYLYDGVTTPVNDAEVDRFVLPKVAESQPS
jgi:hypothetical protein